MSCLRYLDALLLSRSCYLLVSDAPCEFVCVRVVCMLMGEASDGGIDKCIGIEALGQ